MIINQFPHLKIRNPHLNPNGFCFTRAGYHAAVIVRKNHDRRIGQIRPEQLLAGGIEVIAIDKGYHKFSAAKILNPLLERSCMYFLSPVRKCQFGCFTPNVLACCFKKAGVSCSGSIVIEAIPKSKFP